MTKQIQLEGDLLNKFRAKFGEEADPSKFYCFKARSFSTEPIHYYGVYNGAVATRSSLFEMSNIINTTDQNVGVLVLHNDEKLNLGRCFKAEVVDEGIHSSLHVTMGILRTQESDSIIERIENGVLDEVSVSIVPKEIKCSECDFDYADEDTLENWLTCTCPNGHTIGKDGVHVITDGIANFSEVSIVNRGAAKNPKILENENADYFKLAAGEKKPQRLALTCSFKLEDNMTEQLNEDMKAELEQAQAELVELRAKIDTEAKLAQANETIVAKDEAIADLQAKLAEKDAEIASLKEELAKSQESLSASEEKGKETLQFLQSEVKKVLTASGSNEDVPEDLNGISSLLGEKQQILASLIPAGGVSAQYGAKKVSLKELTGFESEQLKAFQVKQ